MPGADSPRTLVRRVRTAGEHRSVRPSVRVPGKPGALEEGEVASGGDACVSLKSHLLTNANPRLSGRARTNDWAAPPPRPGEGSPDP